MPRRKDATGSKKENQRDFIIQPRIVTTKPGRRWMNENRLNEPGTG